MSQPTEPRSPEVVEEDAHVGTLYARLDALREQTAEQLADVRRTVATGTHQSRFERDAFATLYEDRLSQLWSVENRLCFGRLDLQPGTEDPRRYVGRLGLADERGTQVLVDWRAPAAQDFYQATAASPRDVVRRRHLLTRGRHVTGVDDEVLVAAEGERTTGDAALLAAVTAPRTGRMTDIVATIQAEQDRVIRASERGVLVVQGGPGTGKTAVALHRTAYLLYTHRERLARSGVLLLGPSPVFLRYVEQVLPALGETGVVPSTVGDLFPGVTATGEETPGAVAVKGDLRMVDVLAAAVAQRQRVPERAVTLDVDGTRLVLRPDAVVSARTRARRSHRPHNEARVVFVREVLTVLVNQLARGRGVDLGEEREDLLTELRENVDVRREVNLLWMPLTPQKVLGALYRNPSLLARVAPQFGADERGELFRETTRTWTESDVPLLDELAELLGTSEEAGRAERRDAEREEQVAYARKVLEDFEASGVGNPLVSPELLADRFSTDGPTGTVAERAAADRTWAYGHVVVDEAQELSPMAWRLVERRCPSRSMTLVGDVAQTSSAAGASSWAEALRPLVDDRWRLEELTVNYRTPARIARVAADVLEVAGIDAKPPTPVREGDFEPEARRLASADDVAGVVAAVRAERRDLAEGRLAVLVAQEAGPLGAAALRAAVARELPAGSVAASHDDLDADVSVLDVQRAKGLEFDVVVVVEPAAVLRRPRGANDLYVALTRATQKLVVLHAEALPEGMRSLVSA
ncbi:HelD family protein [Kineococcus rubinsiae]|uniref:HelD family protein n=1 Tax=Kineococcus rubinsiae TaxID=2609562 RepID=UPI00143022D0|nr:ATP-binding domain-containing protein [Kineococcus rubinsiae]NIZ93472.1 AAA family ATPase [Kineococcus rubinsiae]